MGPIVCDVVVVGAGPAGSLAARAAAENGAETVLLEEHPQPGAPVYCAEGLSVGGILDGGLEPRPPYVAQEIKTARVFAPGGRHLDLTSGEWTGYTLNREMFDKALADKAVEAGARLFTSTRVVDLVWDGSRVAGVKAVSEGGPLEFRSRVVIGADGHWSIVRRRAGLQRYFADYVSCAQYQLGGLKLEDPTVNEFYLGARYAPGGYAWVFPKSEEVANVGLGVRRIHTKPAVEYLQDFCQADPRFRDAKVLKVNGGICPVSGVLDEITRDGLILVGDAAGMLVPMTGAGIHSSIVAGRMAGEVAARAVEEGDISAARLGAFRKSFDEYWGRRIRDSRRVLEMLDRFTDEDLDLLAEVVTSQDIISLANGENVAATLAGLVRRSPGKILRLIRAAL
ncbi:MAG TPA: NAD(P)/FAD-dependent oxidoreductase [Candidatus Bathyarchaeota archaeon]|nr:NAD(P)/FAD-dependent oxidoreductase [Candidatus Bathyarchaeota archaeon]